MKSTWPFLLGLLLWATPAAVQAQLNYTINGGAVTITGYYGIAPSGDFVIPASLDNLPVTGIGNYAFDDLTSVTNVTVPATVTNIGIGAFSGCAYLTAIIVDAQNPRYSSTNGVLFDKTLSTLVEFPGGLVGNYTIPGGVTAIGPSAFGQCYSLTNVTISGSVTGIGNDAFTGCTSLANVAIPGSVINIGVGVFFGCAKLTAITVDAQNSVYSSTNGVLFDKDQTTLIECPGGLAGNYTIPAGVTSIGDYAFEDCRSLSNVTISGTVTNIGIVAFFGCAALKAIMVDAQNPVYSSTNGVLFDKNQATLVEYPAGLAGKYPIPGSVTSIGDYAFENCQNLSNVTIPGTVGKIGVDAFENCSSLAAVTIPGSVTNIGEEAFDFCISLTSVTIPGSVARIGAGAFENCSELAKLTISDGVTSVASNAFENCYSLANFAIPGSVTNIGAGAFDYCLSLTSVTIPDGVTSIGDDAFAFCSSLAGITIPASVTNIGQAAFGYCSSLAGISIPSGVAGIDPYTFYECAGLTSVTIPANVTDIGVAAFEQCYGLADVTILGSVTNIGSGAFGGTTVSNFYFTGNAPAADSSAFDMNNSPAFYYLPGTIGWAEFSTNTGVPATLWNPVIQTGDGGFGVRNDQFGFNITGATNLAVVVEASANLTEPIWTPIESVTLTNGMFRFSEPVQTNVSSRFYGLGFP